MKSYWRFLARLYRRGEDFSVRASDARTFRSPALRRERRRRLAPLVARFKAAREELTWME